MQYGIYVDSEETGHLYLSYFDTEPLDPAFYSFGSRNSDVQILNAHITTLNNDEQFKLKCSPTSSYSKATEFACDYKCHPACDGCTKTNSVKHCKKCLYAAIYTKNNNTFSEDDDDEYNHVDIECSMSCPIGFEPKFYNKICTGKHLN